MLTDEQINALAAEKYNGACKHAFADGIRVGQATSAALLTKREVIAVSFIQGFLHNAAVCQSSTNRDIVHKSLEMADYFIEEAKIM